MRPESIIDNIRRKKTPLYRFIYKIGKKLKYIQIPYIKPIAAVFYYERILRHKTWYFISNKFYYEHLLKLRCYKIGKNVRTDGDIPLIIGSGNISLGSNVFIGNQQAWILQRNLFQDPELIIGNHTSVNYRTVISVEQRVEIGNHCRIAEEVKIFDNNSHNIDYNNRDMIKEDVAPVKIEDYVWVGMNSIILKGVTIGMGSVVAAGSVVTKDIPSGVLVGGVPAKIIKQIKQ